MSKKIVNIALLKIVEGKACSSSKTTKSEVPQSPGPDCGREESEYLEYSREHYLADWREDESENVLVFPLLPSYYSTLTSQAQPQMFTLKLFFVPSSLPPCRPPGCQDFTLSYSPRQSGGFLSSRALLFHLLGLGEVSQLLENFKISPSLQIIIPGRSHAQCWFNSTLHNSSQNTLISYNQPGQLWRSGLITNCS